MKERNFPCFISSYFEYSKDGFCPDPFHYWVGVSVVAGALERKVWLVQTEKQIYYPNLYVLLVSLPGMGKSSAANIGVNMLRELKGVNMLPSQVTEAKLIDLFGTRKSFVYKGKEIQHSSRFYYASEASSSLRDIYGEFIALITDFYDSHDVWEKATVKGGEFRLKNICMNMLAGCTFDYLKKLITDNNIMGGFASRLIYIIHDEKVIRRPSWVDDGDEEKDAETRRLLMEDLEQIHSLKGRFTVSKEFKERFVEWFPRYDAARQDIKSEKIQSLMVRKQTNLLKLCMVISASRSNDMVLTEEHWNEAMKQLDHIEPDIPRMLQASEAANVETQKGLNMAILTCLNDSPKKELTENLLKGKLIALGFDPLKIKTTLDMMCASAVQVKRGTSEDGRSVYQLLVDPNDNL